MSSGLDIHIADEELAARIRAAAADRGQTPDEYCETVLEQTPLVRSPEERTEAFRELREYVEEFRRKYGRKDVDIRALIEDGRRY